MSTRKKIFFALASLALALLFIEVALRLFQVGDFQPKAFIRTTLGPGHCYSIDNGRGLPYSIKDSPQDRARLRKILLQYSIGAPYKVILKKKEPVDMGELIARTPHCVVYDINEKKRGYGSESGRPVVLVGDSFTFGEGIKATDSLAYYLAQRFPGSRFSNYGESGADISMVLAQLARVRANGVKFRHVIYFFNPNDVTPPSVFDANSYCPVKSRECKSSIGLAGDMKQGPPSHISKIMALIIRAMQQQDSFAINYEAFRRTYLDPAYANELKNDFDKVKEMEALAAKAGTSLSVVVYPWLLSDSRGNYQLKAVHEVILRELKQRKVQAIDGALAFAHKAPLRTYWAHPSDAHPNGEANKIMVDFLFSWLQQQRLVQ